MKIDDSQLSPKSDSESGEPSVNGCSKEETSTSPVDTIPFSVEGIQTVVKNRVQNQENRKRKSLDDGFFLEDILRTELQRFKEENTQLRTALKEASKVNQQWRNYHDQRQGYVQKLLATIHDLQQSATATQAGENCSAEILRLKDTLSRQQRDHREHIQLLQLQVKAHRDDWEAERNEKRTSETARALAESQVACLHEQLEQATLMLEELEIRLRQCHCFSLLSEGNISARCTEDDSSSLNDCSLTSSSPVCGENGIPARSRSSSNSGELSAPVSPLLQKKNYQKFSLKLSHEDESRDIVKRVDAGSRSRSSGFRDATGCQGNNQDSTKEQLFQTSFSESLPYYRLNDPDKRAVGKNLQSMETYEPLSQNQPRGSTELKNCSNGYTKNGSSSHADQHEISYESKGARPKHLNLGKTPIEDEKQAKHRARSILASALPLSPSSSIPSSPVSAPQAKMIYTDVSKNYIPITSTILTTAKKSTHCQVSNQSNYDTGKSTCSVTKDVFNSDVNSNHLISQAKTYTTEATNDMNVTPSQVSSFSTFGNISNHNGAPMDCDKANQSKTSVQNASMTHCNSISICQHDHIQRDASINGSTGFIEISTSSVPAAIIKENKKVKNISNNQQEKLVTNYAPISVMPSPIAAVCSTSQGASTASSRSSSPGISLTTFALNANGQGVPGAMFLALGAENQKLSKSASVSHCSNELNTAEATCRIKMKETNNLIGSQDGLSNGRLVNSAWVKLMDKENSHLRSSAGIPWRTARAVPSHQLNSVKRLHHEDNSLHNIQENALITTTNYAQISRFSSLEGLKNINLENNCNGSVSVSKLNISPCHSDTKAPSSSEGFAVKSKSSSPTYNSSVSAAPLGGIFQFPLQSRSDLMTMASRNISSAILNYEYGNKLQRPQS